jgi:Ca-activated chloride channel homolog
MSGFGLHSHDVVRAALLAAGFLAVTNTPAAQQQDTGSGLRFRSAVELINVTATVTDQSGRFVSGLRREDFLLYEDGVQQPITHFSDDRVPVSLGIVLDTSGSMEGEKWLSALSAIDGFLQDLRDPEDEFFLYTFSDRTDLAEAWTSDRSRIMGALRRISPGGGTAMYDAVGEAIPIAQSGTQRKKALVVISDGNDHHSSIDVASLRRLIRETEVLVYAVGIDGEAEFTWRGGGRTFPPPPIRVPFPIPGRRPPPWPGQPRHPSGPVVVRGGSERVDADALREMTDDNGGRTEVVRTGRNLGPATAAIASELSKQYSLGYSPAAAKDGRWHSIRLETRTRSHRVRARRGYVAST